MKSSMGRCLLLKSIMFIVTVVILVQSVLIAGAQSDENKIHPELSEQMALSLSNTSQDSLYVIILMKEQYQPSGVKNSENIGIMVSKDSKDRNDNTYREQNRRETIRNLKEQSQHSQREIDHVLEEKKPDKIHNVQPLWILNAIGLEATPDMIEELAQRDDVAEIIPNFQVHALEEPMDGGIVSALAASTAWGVTMINAPQVWDLEINGTGINVSIIDSGMDYTHPDLADSYLLGYDFVNIDSDPLDDNGHGTHVAGIIAGNGANGTNTGVAPGVNLLVAKVLDNNGIGDLLKVIQASEWSIENGADIISMSFGATTHQDYMTDMVDNIVASGVIPVIAAGNSGPSSSTITCPGDEENAITVGASDTSDIIFSNSSRGPVTGINGTYTKPDVVAPGVGIVSTSITGVSYTSMSGTSMATSHVSGAAALVLQADPDLTPLEIRRLLEDTAIDLGTAGKDNESGSGRIDVYRAISIQPPDVSGVSITPNPTDVNAVLNATISDLFNNISYVDFYIDDDSNNSTVLSASDGAFDSRYENVTGIINISTLSDGTYVITIRAKDSLDNWNNNTNISFTVDTNPPWINLTFPAGNYIQNGTIIQFNISDLLLTNVTISINSTQANYSNTTNKTFLPPYEINTSGWNESVYRITIWANDSLGHERILSYQFEIDDTLPTITSIEHNATGIIDQGYTLWVNLTGAGGNISYFRIIGTEINQPLSRITSNYYSTNFPIPQGIEVNSSNLTGYLIDRAGNLNSSNASTTISIDSLSPRINLTSPANISYIRSGTIIHFTISDTFLANVTYSLNSIQVNYTNITHQTFPAPYQINTTGWNESSFDLTIWANDSLNHIAISNYHIIVDNNDPDLTITSPSPDHSTTSTSVTIQGTSDVDADITINGVLVASNNGTFTQTYSLVLGHNKFTINATDTAGNVNSTVLTVIRYTLNVPSSGGGWGSVGTSGEDFNNIAETQTQRNTILKNRPVSYGFEKTLNPIIYINFSAKLSAGMVVSKIEVLRHTSTLVEMPAPGLVYKNINIWVGNYGWASDRSIVNATIIFVVPKEWITFHSVQNGSIVLYRYHNDSWEPLPTTERYTNGQYIYYESATPDFSPFAISGEPGPAQTVVQTPVPAPVKNISVVLNEKVPVEPELDGWKAMFWALIIVGVLLLIATIYDSQDSIHKVIDNIKQRGWR
ncbi:MAG: S8 family serine peptidase [ANME-2 cluster archaeon]|nr:S8 family serine peptidase [ANME-2 cluster archaeon]